jgi:hypothetical protein
MKRRNNSEARRTIAGLRLRNTPLLVEFSVPSSDEKTRICVLLVVQWLPFPSKKVKTKGLCALATVTVHT